MNERVLNHLADRCMRRNLKSLRCEYVKHVLKRGLGIVLQFLLLRTNVRFQKFLPLSIVESMSSFFLPLLKLLFQVRLQCCELVLEVLAASPALHVPAWPVARVETIAVFF
jgi:hypothetical protein